MKASIIIINNKHAPYKLLSVSLTKIIINVPLVTGGFEMAAGVRFIDIIDTL